MKIIKSIWESLVSISYNTLVVFGFVSCITVWMLCMFVIAEHGGNIDSLIMPVYILTYVALGAFLIIAINRIVIMLKKGMKK